jgi:ribonuclease HIII
LAPPKAGYSKKRIRKGMEEANKRIIRRVPRSELGWIGTDESGKGDFFGPLVIAGVYMDKNRVERLKNLHIRDSKKISDNVIMQMDYRIRTTCAYSVVVIGPEKYNLLYEKMKNLNLLLAWGHARVIENILLRIECPKAVADQFGDESYIKNALMEKGRKISLKQMPQGETDFAVAAASILARAEFLRRLSLLSQEAGLALPKGSSALVDDVAKKVLEKFGKENLVKFVKLHFKNRDKILCPQPPRDAKI